MHVSLYAVWQSTKSWTCISKQAWVAQSLISFAYINMLISFCPSLHYPICSRMKWQRRLCILRDVMSLTDPLWNGMKCNVSWWQLCLLDWMSQIKRFLFLFAHFFLFMIRASPSKSSGLSFSFSITLKTLPSPCRCTTLLAVPLDKVNALGFTNTSI